MPPDGRHVLNNQGTDDYVLTDERQGFIWVLNTCVFYIADYNFGLVS